MKTWSLMTLHALIIYVAIRMPDLNANGIRHLNFWRGNFTAACAPCWKPQAGHRTNTAQARRSWGVKLCKSARGLERGAL